MKIFKVCDIRKKDDKKKNDDPDKKNINIFFLIKIFLLLAAVSYCFFFPWGTQTWAYKWWKQTKGKETSDFGLSCWPYFQIKETNLTSACPAFIHMKKLKCPSSKKPCPDRDYYLKSQENKYNRSIVCRYKDQEDTPPNAESDSPVAIPIDVAIHYEGGMYGYCIPHVAETLLKVFYSEKK
ncbi:MAG: hypothetical protein IPO55_11700 [Alphaproteobacteria bacterium]|nr:hypothetical protein [Alphaproteobacteria bacterium]